MNLLPRSSGTRLVLRLNTFNIVESIFGESYGDAPKILSTMLNVLSLSTSLVPEDLGSKFTA